MPPPQNPPELLKRPISSAYPPLQLPPEDPNSTLSKIMDFIGGFTGFGGGLTDPKSSNASALGDALGTLNPEKWMMAPLAGMTKFIKPMVRGGEVVRVPDTARRILKTEQNLKDLETFMRTYGASEQDIQAALKIHSKYPRTTAHIDEFVKTLDPRLAGYMKAIPGTPTTGSRVEVGLNPDKLSISSLINPNRSPYAETAAHELQHVAQTIPDIAKQNQRYNLNQQQFGYTNQPEEVAARMGARRRVLETNPVEFPSNVPGKLQYLPHQEGQPFRRVINNEIAPNRYQIFEQEMGPGMSKFVTKLIKYSSKPPGMRPEPRKVVQLPTELPQYTVRPKK